MAPFAELAVAIAADAQKYYDGLNQTVNQTKGWADNIGGIASMALGGVVVGAATAVVGGMAAIGTAAFQVSDDTAQAAANMAASLDVPAERAEAFADIARQVYGNNFAGSVVEAGDVVAEAYRRMGDVGNEQLQRISEQAFALADNFDTGPTEAISAAQTLMDEFGLTSDQAFDFIAKGFQKGLNRSGDFLETINEYATQFSEADANAGQFFSVLETGMQGGALGTDKAADLFKEFVVRIQDGSKTTASSLEAIGINSEYVLEQLASGQISAANVFDLVVQKLGEVDSATQMQAGVGLLGTQFEDLGASAALSIDIYSASVDDMVGAADQLNAKYNTFGDMFAGIWRKAVVSVAPATDKLLELANEAMPYVEQGFDFLADKVPPAIDFVVRAVDTGVDFIKGLFDGPLQDGLDNGVGAFETVQDWIDTNMPLIQATIATVLGAITAFWDEHGDAIMTVVRNFMSIVQTLFDTYLNNALDIVTAVMQLITGDFEGAEETILGIVDRTWAAVLSIIGTMIRNIQTVIEDVDWLALGRNIIEGIANGVGFAAHLLVEAVKASAGWALEGVKALLGIASPSQVMADEVGLPMVQGIMRGFADNLPALEGLSLNMSGVAAGAGGGAGIMPAPITINIYTDDARTAGDSVVQSLRAYGLAA